MMKNPGPWRNDPAPHSPSPGTTYLFSLHIYIYIRMMESKLGFPGGQQAGGQAQTFNL